MKTTNKKFIWIVLFSLLSTVSLLACGSGGGGGGSGGGTVALTESPSGAWVGILHSNAANQTTSVTGTVSENNELTFIDWDTGNQFTGTFSGSGNQISCTIKGYAYSGTTFPDGSSVANIHIEGTISSKNTMTLTYSGGGDNGNVSLIYDNANYERPSSLALISGTWILDGSTDTISIDSNGNISGTVMGCTITGNISIINSSYNAYQISITFSNCGSDNGTYSGLASLWDYNSTNDSLEIMISDDTVSGYFGFTRSLAVDGTLKWAFPMGDVRSSPALGLDGTLYIGSSDHSLYAINPNGSLKWRFATNAAIVRSSPTIGQDGTIYVGSEDSYLYAVNPNGSLKWRFHTPNAAVQQSPALGSDGTLYIGVHNNNGLYAINPDGSQKWNFPMLSAYSPAIGGDGTIYVGSEDNNLYAVNPNGSLKWRFATNDWIRAAPALGADGTIYIGSRDNNFYAVNPDGSLKWTFPTGSDVDTSAVIGWDDTIYVASQDNNLYAINPDGTQKWVFGIGSYGAAPALGADGTIYIGSRDGIDAVNPDGSLKWTYSMWIDGAFPNIAHGTVYIGSRDHNLYAIYDSSGGVANSPWPLFQSDAQHTGN